MRMVRFGMGHRQEGARLIGDVLEVDQAAALADDVEEIAMLAGGSVGPFAGGALAGFAALSPPEHRAAGRIADIADQPIAALAMAGGQVMPAHRLGLSAKTDRQLGSVVPCHHAASRSLTRSTG